MGVPDSQLEELERQRRELEDNIWKLQESLYHWRTWEAEYDGLKDEINDLDSDATTDEFLRIGREFGGDLVNEEEVKVILGAKQGVTRSKEQAVNLIVRRIDYVMENVKTIEKRLRMAESKRAELDATGQAPVEMGGDFPMTEIMEELDEAGNVVSSSMQTPGSQAPELLEILKKAGVKDVPEAQTGTKSATVEEAQPDEESKVQGTSDIPQESQLETEPVPAKVEEVEEVAEEQPVTDVNESPEDAALRREMLEYGLNEVGSVVAELELDDSASDVSLDDSYGDYDDEDEDEDEDEFGRSTRSVFSEDYHRQMRELEEKLNARGMWNMGKDAGALPSEMKQDLEQPQAVKIEPSDKNAPVSKKGKQKKKVSFADDLDIAPAESIPEKRTLPPQQPEIPTITDSVVERAESAPKTVSKEPPKKVSRFKSARSGMAKSNPDETPAPSQPSAPSRPPEVRSTPHTLAAPVSPGLPLFPAKPAEPKPFSQPIADIFQHERPPAAQPQSQANPPEDRILAEKLVERDIPEGKAAAPEQEDVDDQLHRKEIASEYYRMRNRMGQQNGGIVDDEPETVPLETEEAPKVSRFKAARMR